MSVATVSHIDSHIGADQGVFRPEAGCLIDEDGVTPCSAVEPLPGFRVGAVPPARVAVEGIEDEDAAWLLDRSPAA